MAPPDGVTALVALGANEFELPIMFFATPDAARAHLLALGFTADDLVPMPPGPERVSVFVDDEDESFSGYPMGLAPYRTHWRTESRAGEPLVRWLDGEAIHPTGEGTINASRHLFSSYYGGSGEISELVCRTYPFGVRAVRFSLD